MPWLWSRTAAILPNFSVQFGTLIVVSASLIDAFHSFEFPLPYPVIRPQPKTQIFIKTLTGRKQPLNFEPDNQVLAVKQALQEKEGIQVDQIRLIFSGRQL